MIRESLASSRRSSSLRLVLTLPLHAGSPNEPEAQDVGVQALESVLRVAKARELAWEAEQEEGQQSENGKSAGAAAMKPKVVEG
jgi:hypothetical protein